MDNKNYKKNKIIDIFFKYFFGFFAFLSIVFLLVITGYIFFTGVKPFVNGEYNFWNFLIGMNWNNKLQIYGILYMILGTIFSTLIAVAIAIPISLLTAAAVSELLPSKISSFVSTIIELLSSIPSIIYGMIGAVVLVPIFSKLQLNPYPQGQSLLTVSLVLMIMILPTITIVAISSIKAVPNHLKEASRGLGVSKIKTIFRVVIPAAKKGITSGVILGIGRAIGETMAVAMVAGNVGKNFTLYPLDKFLFQSVRPLTVNIAMNIGEASGLQKELLFSTALVLFFFIFFLNILVEKIANGGKS